MSDVKTGKDPGRLEVLRKIAEYERNGWFDRDVENDPATPPIDPGAIDFLNRKPLNRIKRNLAYFAGKVFYSRMLKRKEVIFKGVTGLENLEALNGGGAVVTCNHFNIFDNYAVYLGIRKYFKTKRLYKLVREGNYFIPGMMGFFVRYADTLPLCGNPRAMMECMDAVRTALKSGGLVLVYPEQGMWWNYRKPRPLKPGAFKFAAKNGVPVVPCFITLSDSDIIGKDGFLVQEYTLHILPVIPFDKNLSVAENCEKAKEKNFSLWKEVYEKNYGKTLCYTED